MQFKHNIYQNFNSLQVIILFVEVINITFLKQTIADFEILPTHTISMGQF